MDSIRMEPDRSCVKTCRAAGPRPKLSASGFAPPAAFSGLFSAGTSGLVPDIAICHSLMSPFSTCYCPLEGRSRGIRWCALGLALMGLQPCHQKSLWQPQAVSSVLLGRHQPQAACSVQSQAASLVMLGAHQRRSELPGQHPFLVDGTTSCSLKSSRRGDGKDVRLLRQRLLAESSRGGDGKAEWPLRLPSLWLLGAGCFVASRRYHEPASLGHRGWRISDGRGGRACGATQSALGCQA